MGMNPLALLKFTKNHPKFLAFLKAAQQNNYLAEGCVMDITLKRPDGQQIHTNLRVTQDDLDLIAALRSEKGF